MADKTTPPKDPLSIKPPSNNPDTASKNQATSRPRRSSIIEQLNQIAAEYDAQTAALDDLLETGNLTFAEEAFTTVPGHELLIDRSTNPLAEFDEEDDAAADPFTVEAASAFLRQAEILKLQANLRREAGGGK